MERIQEQVRSLTDELNTLRGEIVTIKTAHEHDVAGVTQRDG